ncbi:MAG: M48 family metalloprotease [Actinomycetota bacterium]|nr:M48 family metalloprotease [Actinomycetota bacterium]
MTTAARDAARHWNVPRPASPAAVEYAWAAVLIGGPGLVLGVAAGWLIAPAAGVAVALAYGLAVALWMGMQGRRVLRKLGARPLEKSEAPRVVNLARGLARDIGIGEPTLWLIDDPEANALVCRAGGNALAVTQGLLERFTRTELEAVLAHCMLRLAGGDLTRAALASALGGLAGPLAPHRDLAEDSSAAALTRYPPALASAIGKCKARDTGWGAYWFVPLGTRFPSAAKRIQALTDL